MHIFTSIECGQIKLKIDEEQKKDLVDRSARTSIGGTILSVSAFSRNFQASGILLPQHICETRSSATSGDGMVTPEEVRLEESCIAHIKGSVPLS